MMIEMNPSQLRAPARGRGRPRFGFIISSSRRECSKTKRLTDKPARRGIRLAPKLDLKKSRKLILFSGLNLNQTRVSLHPSSIQTITVGPGVSPDHARNDYTCPGGRCQGSRYYGSWAVPPIGNCTLPRRFLFGCRDYTLPSTNCIICARQDIL